MDPPPASDVELFRKGGGGVLARGHIFKLDFFLRQILGQEIVFGRVSAWGQAPSAPSYGRSLKPGRPPPEGGCLQNGRLLFLVHRCIAGVGCSLNG